MRECQTAFVAGPSPNTVAPSSQRRTGDSVTSKGSPPCPTSNVTWENVHPSLAVSRDERAKSELKEILVGLKDKS